MHARSSAPICSELKGASERHTSVCHVCVCGFLLRVRFLGWVQGKDAANFAGPPTLTHKQANAPTSPHTPMAHAHTHKYTHAHARVREHQPVHPPAPAHPHRQTQTQTQTGRCTNTASTHTHTCIEQFELELSSRAGHCFQKALALML